MMSTVISFMKSYDSFVWENVSRYLLIIFPSNDLLTAVTESVSWSWESDNL